MQIRCGMDLRDTPGMLPLWLARLGSCCSFINLSEERKAMHFPHGDILYAGSRSGVGRGEEGGGGTLEDSSCRP